jgi:membrane-associated phospholipid phosphatase
MRSTTDEDVHFALSTDVDIADPLISYMELHGLATRDAMVDALASSQHDEFLTHILYLKDKYNVPRPFVLARYFNVQLPFELDSWTVNSGSYPSGHAASSRFLAHELSRDFLKGHPQEDLHRCELFSLANRIAWGRVQLGVHSMQDIREGKRLADQIFMPTYSYK